MHRRLRQFLYWEPPQAVQDRIIAVSIVVWVALVGVMMVGKMMPELHSGEPPMGDE